MTAPAPLPEVRGLVKDYPGSGPSTASTSP